MTSKSNKIKEGDKVICIKEKVMFDGHKYLIKYEKYKIFVIDDDWVTVTSEIPPWSMGLYSYDLDKNGYGDYFYDYFITENEYRNLKLTKLNNL